MSDCLVSLIGRDKRKKRSGLAIGCLIQHQPSSALSVCTTCLHLPSFFDGTKLRLHLPTRVTRERESTETGLLPSTACCSKRGFLSRHHAVIKIGCGFTSILTSDSPSTVQSAHSETTIHMRTSSSDALRPTPGTGRRRALECEALGSSRLPNYGGKDA